MEGSVAPIPCLESEINECPLSGQCATLPFWAGLDEVINQYLDSVTLADIAKKHGRKRGRTLRPDKKIGLRAKKTP